MEDKKSEEIVIKLPKVPKLSKKIWMYLTILFLFISVTLVLEPGITSNFCVVGCSYEDATNAAVAWIENYYKNMGVDTTVTLLSSSYDPNSGLIEFMIETSSSQGTQEQTLYVTKDGKFFVPQIISTEITAGSNQGTQEETVEVPKSDKPEVDLYVMSYCPYGNIAEEAMKPVVDLLGDKFDINIHYIVSISGDTISSLHGTEEANQDMREACIQRDYSTGVFWDFINYTNNECTLDDIATCWEEAADAVGIDKDSVKECFESEGMSLMQADNALTQENGISGSPTLMINGVRVSVARTPDSYKQAICDAFNTAPEECSQQLSGSTGSSAATGNC